MGELGNCVDSSQSVEFFTKIGEFRYWLRISVAYFEVIDGEPIELTSSRRYQWLFLWERKCSHIITESFRPLNFEAAIDENYSSKNYSSSLENHLISSTIEIVDFVWFQVRYGIEPERATGSKIQVASSRTS